MNINKHVLFTGDTGTGKTAHINQYLANVSNDQYIPLKIMFSAATKVIKLKIYI